MVFEIQVFDVSLSIYQSEKFSSLSKVCKECHTTWCSLKDFFSSKMKLSSECPVF